MRTREKRPQNQAPERFYEKTLTLNEKLTPMKKLRLISAVRKARREGKIAVSAQETIPYVEMYKDGLCKVS